MLKKWVSLMGAVCMMVVLSQPVRAEEGEGSIRVIPVWGGKRIAGGEITLSRVGEKTPEGFRITDGLADWTVSEVEILSESWNWCLQNQGENAVIRAAEEGTGAFFEGLPDGLYLVQQKKAAPEFMSFRPFLLSIPEGEQWEVVREVELISDAGVPLTGHRHIPLIGAMGLGLSAAILMVLVDQRNK